MRVITDSTADLPESILEEYKIEVIPLKVHFGEEQFLDWVDLRPENFYDKLQKSDILPKTSQPSPAEFVEKYKGQNSSNTIFSIHISSQLSGTYQSAMMAKDMLPEMDIVVVDTKLASIPHGLVVFEVARAVKEGKSKEDILALIDYLLSNVRLFFMVDTLEYLQKNGRIGKAQALLGGLLKMKPILTLVDGVVTPKDKVRGHQKALNRLIGLCLEEFSSEKPVQVAILHGNVLEEALKVKAMVEETFNNDEIIITNLGAVIGTHVGPGAVGIAMYHKYA
ncbi:DegV family protein [Candidatus Contubernalis alkaliaceticus]|uniref:DegV family protein n=1 Tax=Candidatus Contubernalis alkaliaceticus TaxID=338645 RepID=UPI001F4BFC74|nr:DegV family protein [Candidatus Contubernalis alkalaceticus]UNC92767.1 DegV family protein [Candidatus Contubernalis alkalaceticus]